MEASKPGAGKDLKREESDSVNMNLPRRILRFLNLNPKQQKIVLNGLGLGLIVFGIYFLLVFFNVIPFTARFEFFNNKNNILIAGIISLILGVLTNEKIRKSIF